MQLTRTHRILIGVVVAGAMVIAAIGFAGSYAAVRDLAEQKGFGGFAPFFPIGVDAGIVVLLALDLLLTWLRIPFPMLRQTAWLLTAATIAFNGAAAWPDPLGVGMHAVIPVLFVVAVEAARHAVGRIADITADKHMEGVRLSRWLLAFPSTFRLWRRMKLWELRSYDQVIRMEQDRLIYEARLRARYGRGWKRRAPVEALMPLRLARYGVPLAETAPAGLAAAGIEPGSGPRAVLPAGAPDGTGAGLALEKAPGETTDQAADQSTDQSTGAERSVEGVGAEGAAVEAPAAPAGRETPVLAPAAPAREPVARRSEVVPPEWEARPEPEPEVEPEPALRPEPANGAADGYGPAPEPAYAAASASPPTVPVSDGRHRPMGNPDARPAHVPSPREAAPPEPDDTVPVGIPDGMVYTEVYYRAYQQYIAVHGDRPNARQLAKVLYDEHGVTNAEGGLLSEGHLRMYLRDFKHRYNAEMGLAG